LAVSPLKGNISSASQLFVNSISKCGIELGDTKVTLSLVGFAFAKATSLSIESTFRSSNEEYAFMTNTIGFPFARIIGGRSILGPSQSWTYFPDK
jgi:hypothetical protein